MTVLHATTQSTDVCARRTADAAGLALLWALSGFSVLTLETLWMREVALRVGSTAVSAALVISSFFVSAALGNLLGGRVAAGRRDRSLQAYGAFEVIAAFSALASLALYRVCRDLFSVAQATSWAAWAVTALLVSVPSFVSGASFPCLAETVVPGAERRTAVAGGLYGANLVGAALGVAAGGVGLPWLMGLTGAFAVAALLQLAGGVFAWALARRLAPVRRDDMGGGSGAMNVPAPVARFVLVASGVLSLAAQALLVVWAHQVLEGSVYATCGVLAVFLVGLGLGGWSAAWMRRRGWPPCSLLAGYAAVSSLGLALAAWWGPAVAEQGFPLTASPPLGLLLQALGVCAPALPLVVGMGGVFPVAWELLGAASASEGRTLGHAMALNKAGAAFGSAAGLFVLLPAAGLVHGTAALAAGYLALMGLAGLCGMSRSAMAVTATAALVCASLIAGVAFRAEPTLGVAPGERVIASRAGAYGPVAVVERASDLSRQILLNSRQRLSGTKRALLSQRCQSWLPLLLCARPQRVFMIGMAAGISAEAALDFPVREAVAVELVPEVAEAAREHFEPWNARLFSDPRARVVVGDGRAVLAREAGAFDAIVCDLFYPAEEGTANLYSREFFGRCRAKLVPGGLCCLWLPCDQHTAVTAGVVTRTFASVFPCAVMVRANFDPLQPVLGLVGSSTPIALSRKALTARLSGPLGERLVSASPLFRSAAALQMSVVMDLRSAEPGFAGYEATTDDRPLFAYVGPRCARGAERLYGFPLVEWCGRRALKPSYPSCGLDGESAESLRGAIRAGNYCYAAAAAVVSLAGDTRPPDVRMMQVSDYVRQAVACNPDAAGEIAAWFKGVETGMEELP